IWKTCTPAQGISSSASARSMIHGVWPPLTARAKRPRAAIAARASSAIVVAAALATESASLYTAYFIGLLQSAGKLAKARTRLRLAGDHYFVCRLGRNPEIFLVHCDRVNPAPRGTNCFVDLTWTPCALVVFIDGSVCFE